MRVEEFLQKYRRNILAFCLLVTISGLMVSAYYYLRANEETPTSNKEPTEKLGDNLSPELQQAVENGKKLHRGKCSGTGPVTLTHLPMNEKDFAFVIPYGLVIGAHVTPIDHQYFSPTDFNSPRDTYPVYAMADGTIVDIQNRTAPPSNGRITDEYRLVFVHTCTFLTYYDLVTSLAPNLKQVFDENNSGGYAANIEYPVKAGELIGYIGGQTLDFAVWDTEKPLTGFVNPDSYEAESWKLYTANPYDYYASDIKEILIAKNLRTIEPMEGKIDYDIEGKLIGNWFLEGTNGYAGVKGSDKYYSGHLSIAPDHLDPTAYVISIGDFFGEARQFTTKRSITDPKDVGVDTEPTKYDLYEMVRYESNGSSWNYTLTKDTKLEAGPSHYGCAIFEVLKGNKLQAEFTDSMCSSWSTFSDNAQVFER